MHRRGVVVSPSLIVGEGPTSALVSRLVPYVSTWRLSCHRYRRHRHKRWTMTTSSTWRNHFTQNVPKQQRKQIYTCALMFTASILLVLSSDIAPIICLFKEFTFIWQTNRCLCFLLCVVLLDDMRDLPCSHLTGISDSYFALQGPRDWCNMLGVFGLLSRLLLYFQQSHFFSVGR